MIPVYTFPTWSPWADQCLSCKWVPCDWGKPWNLSSWWYNLAKSCQRLPQQCPAHILIRSTLNKISSRRYHGHWQSNIRRFFPNNFKGKWDHATVRAFASCCWIEWIGFWFVNHWWSWPCKGRKKRQDVFKKHIIHWKCKPSTTVIPPIIQPLAIHDFHQPLTIYHSQTPLISSWVTTRFTIPYSTTAWTIHWLTQSTHDRTTSEPIRSGLNPKPLPKLTKPFTCWLWLIDYDLPLHVNY